MYYLYLSSHYPAYRLLVVWDLHRTSPESRLDGLRKAAEVLGMPPLYPDYRGASEGREAAAAGGHRGVPLLLGDLELLYEAVEELQGLVEGDDS
jgi:hypothetical protein